MVEKKILEGIKQDLFNDEMFEMFELFIAEVKNQLKQQFTSGNEDKSHIDKELKTIDGEIQNVISAIRSIGISAALTDTLKEGNYLVADVGINSSALLSN